MELLATAPSGFWLFGMRYFFLEVRPPAHWRASAHFSEISRLRLARDRGRGAPRTSARAGKFGHSTPRVPGFSAPIFAHSSTATGMADWNFRSAGGGKARHAEQHTAWITCYRGCGCGRDAGCCSLARGPELSAAESCSRREHVGRHLVP